LPRLHHHFGAVGGAERQTHVVVGHNGNSLGAGIQSEAGFTDNFVISTSSDPLATSASISANLMLEEILEATGPISSAGVEGSIELGFGGGRFHYVLDSGGNLDARNDFIIDSGTVGGDTDLHMHTAFTVMPLNSPASFSMGLLTGVFASGPGCHARSDFIANSFNFIAFGSTGPTAMHAFLRASNAGEIDTRALTPSIRPAARPSARPSPVSPPAARRSTSA
jgi:hypothetical protein